MKFRKRSDNKNCIGYEATSEWTSIDEQGLHGSSEYTQSLASQKSFNLLNSNVNTSLFALDFPCNEPGHRATLGLSKKQLDDKFTKLLACLNNFEPGIWWFIIIYYQSPTCEWWFCRFLALASYIYISIYIYVYIYGFNGSPHTLMSNPRAFARTANDARCHL